MRISVDLPRTVIRSHIVDLIIIIDDTVELHRGAIDGTRQCAEISRILRTPYLEVDVVWRVIVVLVTDIADACGDIDARDDRDCTVTCEIKHISRVYRASLAESENSSHSSVVAVVRVTGSVSLDLEIRTCDCGIIRSLGKGGGSGGIVRRGQSRC